MDGGGRRSPRSRSDRTHCGSLRRIRFRRRRVEEAGGPQADADQDGIGDACTIFDSVSGLAFAKPVEPGTLSNFIDSVFEQQASKSRRRKPARA